MALVQSAEFTTSARPVKSATIPSHGYALSIAPLASRYAVASSFPANTIALYDKVDLRPLSHFTAHGDSITYMRTVPNFIGTARETLVSCAKDGFVNVWDERSSATTAAVQMPGWVANQRYFLYSCDVSASGTTVVAGSAVYKDNAPIIYWDPRNPAAPLRVHSSTHSDDVTAVHYMRSNHVAPSLRNVLLSASTDGLVCASNADEPDEYEAVMHIGNFGCSIAQAGWVHGWDSTPGVWAASDMETFSTWSSDLGLVHNIDFRQPSIHRQDMTWVTDYLIGCHNSPAISPSCDNDLCIFAGSNEGDIALITRSSFSDDSAPYVMEQTWTTGHTGIVRSVLWDEKNNVLLTGGEDSRINVWSAPPPSAPESTASGKRGNDEDDMDVDEAAATTHSRKRRRS